MPISSQQKIDNRRELDIEMRRFYAEALIKRDGIGRRCYYCLEPLGDDYHFEHRVPRARGGKTTFDNLVVSCPKCNYAKQAMTDTEFLIYQYESFDVYVLAKRVCILDDRQQRFHDIMMDLSAYRHSDTGRSVLEDLGDTLSTEVYDQMFSGVQGQTFDVD